MPRPLCALVSLAGALAAAGCAATRPPRLDHDALRASQPRTLIVAEDHSPPITAEGPAHEGGDIRGLFGVVGLVAVAGSNKTANRRRGRLMKGCAVDDPVDGIRENVADALAAALSLEVMDADRRTKAWAKDDVIRDYPGADLILDIRTSKWGVHRVDPPSTRGEVHFAVGYEGSVRLIDARKRTVIAEETCSVQFSNGNAPPTITELLENDCALLDKGLMLTSATCAKRHRAALGLE